MKQYRKQDFPVAQVRRFLEPGPIVLVSSRWKDETNIMTLGWHMVMEFEPSLIGCYVWSRNHSQTLMRRSRECVINLPTADLVDTVVGIGNCSGADGIDKFDRFGLTPQTASLVGAPLIAECPASFECRLHDGRQIRKYSLFIWEVVRAHVARTPKRPQTLHYRGDGEFMLSGTHISRRAKFRPEML